MDKGSDCSPFRFIRGAWWFSYVIGIISTQIDPGNPISVSLDIFFI